VERYQTNVVQDLESSKATEHVSRMSNLSNTEQMVSSNCSNAKWIDFLCT